MHTLKFRSAIPGQLLISESIQYTELKDAVQAGNKLLSLWSGQPSTMFNDVLEGKVKRQRIVSPTQHYMIAIL